MSDVALGGSGKTNKNNNEEVGYNDEHNNNRNGRRPDTSGDHYSLAKFKGKVEGLLNLGVKDFWDFFWK